MLLALVLGFVAYRIAVAFATNTTGVLVALVLGLAAAFGVWALTTPKAKSGRH